VLQAVSLSTHTHLFSTEFVLCHYLLFTLKRKLQGISHTNFYQINSHSLLAILRANCWSLFRRNWLETRGDIVLFVSARPNQNPHFHPRVGSVFLPCLAFEALFSRVFHRLTSSANPFAPATLNASVAVRDRREIQLFTSRGARGTLNVLAYLYRGVPSLERENFQGPFTPRSDYIHL
jgi:hypothetical protein